MTTDSSSSPAGRLERRRAGPAAAGLISFFVIGLIGIAHAHYPIVLSGFRMMHGELGDTRFVHYLLEHSWQWMTGSPLHPAYWDPPIFHPAANTLAYSEIMLGAAPLYWPWRLIGLVPDTAFQWWQLSVSAANYALMAVLLRRGFRFTPLAAAFGAFLFAFGAPRLAQAGHFQLLPQFATPLYAWAIVEFFRAERPPLARRWAAVAVGALVLQLYAGFYLGWFLVLGTFLVALAALLLADTRRALLRKLAAHWLVILACGAGGLLALVPMVLHYGAAVRQLGGLRSFAEVVPMIPRPESWLYLGGHSYLYAWTARSPFFANLGSFSYEHVLGVGLVTALLAVGGLWVARRDRKVLLVGGALAMLFVFTLLLPGDFTLWKGFYAAFPGAKAIRALTRIVLLALVPLSIGLAAALTHLQGSRGRWVALALGTFAMAEQGQRTLKYDKHADRAEIAWLAAQVPPHCQTFFFTPIHGARPFYKYQLDAMWAADQVGIPTLNGYSGNVPPGYLMVWDNFVRSPSNWGLIDRFLLTWPAHHQFSFDRSCWLRLVPSDTSLTAEVLGQQVPTAVEAGQRFTAQITVKNTGGIGWARDQQFALGSRSDEATPWGVHRVALPRDVPPGQELTLSFDLQAPSQPGQYPFQWQMLQENVLWFGDPTPPVQVEVLPAGTAGAPPP